MPLQMCRSLICSLDELLQCVNRLFGKPLLLVDSGLKLYQKFQPVITGWLNSNGRSDIVYRDRPAPE